MARQHRVDGDGIDLHIMNRGGSRRTIFEFRRDFRYFKSRLAYAVRRGEIEVHAFVLMMTHFHILLRSRGRLSEALRRIQNEYVRSFNRSRRRDGALCRGRFVSKPIYSVTYLRNVYRYLDENAVQARLVQRPEDWPWGSAWHFARGRVPRWLTPTTWESFRREDSGELDPPDVRRARAELIESRLLRSAPGPDPLDDLVSGLPDRVWSWMIRKAALADGTSPGVPVAGVQTVEASLGALPPSLLSRGLSPQGTKLHPIELLLRVGLLRDLASASFAEIASLVARSPTNTQKLHRLHVRALQTDGDDGRAAQDIVEVCMRPLRG